MKRPADWISDLHSFRHRQPLLYDYYRYETIGFTKFKLVIVGAFHNMVMDGIPERFPKLKVAFLEAGAQWLPYVLKDLAKRYTTGPRIGHESTVIHESFLCRLRDQRRSAVHHVAGEDNLVVGTDYGHADSATELLQHSRVCCKTNG